MYFFLPVFWNKFTIRIGVPTFPAFAFGEFESLNSRVKKEIEPED